MGRDFSYEGNFIDGMKNGKGNILLIKQGSLKSIEGEYTGQWLNDEKNGWGKMIYSNDKNPDVYEGSWVNGMRNGQGEYLFFNGDSYKGFWVNDKK